MKFSIKSFVIETCLHDRNCRKYLNIFIRDSGQNIVLMLDNWKIGLNRENDMRHQREHGKHSDI